MIIFKYELLINIVSYRQLLGGLNFRVQKRLIIDILCMCRIELKKLFADNLAQCWEEDPRARIHIDNLLTTISKGRTIKKSFIYGSEIPGSMVILFSSGFYQCGNLHLFVEKAFIYMT